MKLTIITITITFCLLRVVNAQSVTSERQKNFKFYYAQARSLAKEKPYEASVSVIKALAYTESRVENYKANFLLAYIYHFQHETTLCVKYYEKALRYAKNKDQEMFVRNNLANNLLELGELEKAWLHAVKVRKYREKVRHKYLCNTLGIMAKVHGLRGNVDSAMYYFERAVENIDSSIDKDGVVTAGFLTAQAKMLLQNKKLNLAIVKYRKSLLYKQFAYERCEVFLGVAECFIEKEDYIEAEKYIDRAKELQVTHVYCKANVLRLTVRLQRCKEQYKNLAVSFDQLLSFMKENSSLLLKEDKDLFFKLQGDIRFISLVLAGQGKSDSLKLLFLTITLVIVFLMIAFIKHKKKKRRGKRMEVVYSATDSSLDYGKLDSIRDWRKNR